VQRNATQRNATQRNATHLFFSDTQEITNAGANLVAYLVDAGTHSDRGWWNK
jgi:hypothetical protein